MRPKSNPREEMHMPMNLWRQRRSQRTARRCGGKDRAPRAHAPRQRTGDGRTLSGQSGLRGAGGRTCVRKAHGKWRTVMSGGQKHEAVDKRAGWRALRRGRPAGGQTDEMLRAGDGTQRCGADMACCAVKCNQRR